MKHLAKILPVFLALAMLFGLGCSVNAESITSADATTMRLMRTDGTVLLADGSGSLSVQGQFKASSNTLRLCDHSSS